MRNILSQFATDETGATAIEYGLIAAIVALGIVASLGSVRDALTGLFANVGGNLNAN